jgi:ubiquinone/menaquinone biosynthesis C-methylase UbiE
MINPKDLANNLTVEELCQTAENYFRAISNPTPQMAKPFDSLLTCPQMLQNMGLLLSGLRLGKTMTVLDFGAGTSWFSRFLNQLQCQTISCDPSTTALAIGKRLFQEFPIIGDWVSEPIFLHFDGHKIDLPDSSIDRIVCFDTFHHIPNHDEVIGEFARVLKTGGVAGFSEPGRFHSQTPQSQYEMRNFNVLENDIDITQIFEIAKRKGFTDFSCKVLCDMEVSLDKYSSLTTKRCNRGFGEKVYRTVLNVVTNRALKEKIYHNICNSMTNKTIFFLYKGHSIPDSRSHTGLSHSIKVERNTFSVKQGERLDVSLTIVNNGGTKWLHENIRGIGVVMIGTHLYDKDNKLINLDFSRHTLAGPVLPGESVKKTISMKFSDKGTFRVAIDLVSEGICWFENVGSHPQYIKTDVE